MCGLFGLYSTLITKNDQDLFFDLGIVSSLRGLDSTGIAAAYRTKKSNFTFAAMKDATDAIGFFNQKATQERLARLNKPVALLGHTRSATIGSISKDNAHPFFHGNILGMHNGTIPSLKPADGSTDSEELIKRINNLGLQGALDSINGDAAYALVWFNAKTQTLHFLRNKERTLWHMKTISGHTLVYASEKAFLDLISARSMSVWKAPQPFDIDKLYTFKLPDMDPAGVEEVRPTPRPLFPGLGRLAEQPTIPPRILPTITDGCVEGGSALTRLPVLYNSQKDLDPPFELTKPGGVIPNAWEPPKVYFKQVPIGGYPHKLTVNGVNKLLWYLDHYGNPQLPRTMVPLLQEGCLISTHKPEIYEHVLWIAPGIFVMPEHQHDEFVRDYLSGDKPRLGGPIYATCSSVANYRKMKRAAWMRRDNDDEGAHHNEVQVH